MNHPSASIVYQQPGEIYGDCPCRCALQASANREREGFRRVSIKAVRAIAVEILDGAGFSVVVARVLDDYELQANQFLTPQALYDPGATEVDLYRWATEPFGPYCLQRRLEYLRRESYWAWQRTHLSPDPAKAESELRAFYLELAKTEREAAPLPAVYFTPSLLVTTFAGLLPPTVRESQALPRSVQAPIRVLMLVLVC